MWCTTLAFAVFWLAAYVSALDFRYHRYPEMTKFLKNYTYANPNLTRLYSIGKSRNGLDLWVVEVTATTEPKLGVPNVKLIGNIHGNEPVGRELILHMIEYLVENYKTDARVSWLLDNTRVHLMPSMNPDGFEVASEGLCELGLGRANANQVDLNRSFPDFFRKNDKKPEPETCAVMKWMDDIPFILSASLHGGALVANYPFENSKENVPSMKQQPSISPDDDVFRSLAKLYANRHPTMHLGQPCKKNTDFVFKGGITNGAAWYPLIGGMQDYNYFAHGCMEITLEISCCKYPPARELNLFWSSNKLALLDYMSEAHKGVKGLINDGLTNLPIKNASLQIVGRNMTFRSSNRGEFWRILLPGNYQLAVSAKGYQSTIFDFDIKKNSTNLTLKLYPEGYKITTPENTVAPTDGSTSPIAVSSRDIISNAVSTAQNKPEYNITDSQLQGDVDVEHPVYGEVMSRSSYLSCYYIVVLLCLSVMLF